MTAELGNYQGREQSYIKHLFLTQYLQTAAYKILQGRSPTFNFVDAFAGPWQVSDEDCSDASFDQALRTLESVRASLGKNGVAGLKIRFCFCEKRSNAVEELKKYANKHKRFEIHIFHGSFEDHLESIASVCKDGFTLTFIDPTGWNIDSAPIFDFLNKQNGEFLLNFMAEHVNRHAEYSKVAESFGRFLADPNWADNFNTLPSGWNNEERVLYLLKQKIKSKEAATYLPDFPILKPHENRIKMRLILGTHSSSGLEVFRNVQKKVELHEIETRNQLRDAESQQVSLFTDDEIAAIEQDQAGVDCSKYQRETEVLILRLLKSRKTCTFKLLANETLENIPLRLTKLKSLLTNMKNDGLVSFDLPPRKRVPQPDTIISLATP